MFLVGKTQCSLEQLPVAQFPFILGESGARLEYWIKKGGCVRNYLDGGADTGHEAKPQKGHLFPAKGTRSSPDLRLDIRDSSHPPAGSRPTAIASSGSYRGWSSARLRTDPTSSQHKLFLYPQTIQQSKCILRVNPQIHKDPLENAWGAKSPTVQSSVEQVICQICMEIGAKMEELRAIWFNRLLEDYLTESNRPLESATTALKANWPDLICRLKDYKVGN